MLIQVAIVTGGNTGIGYLTVYWLLKKNAKVYLAARSEGRAREAIQKLEAENLPGSVEWLKLDLADLNSVKAFATAFQGKEKRLDLLFNNGGVMYPRLMPDTVDGYEMHLGTNGLGHHYLTKLLLPTLLATQKVSPSNPPRVCFTSSLAHRFASAEGFKPEDPTGLGSRPFYLSPASRAYGTSKLVNILSANKFQRQYGPEGLVFTSVHPGILYTELMRDWNPLFGVTQLIQSYLFYPASMGCLTQLFANTAPEAAKKGGSYFVPWAREAEPMPIAHDKANQDACMFLYSLQSMPGSTCRLPSTSNSVRRRAHKRHVAMVRAPSRCPRN